MNKNDFEKGLSESSFVWAIEQMKKGIECRPSHWETGMTGTIRKGENTKFTLQDIESND